MLTPARHFVAVLVLVTLPPAVGIWYFIHPLAKMWRRVGAGITYAVLLCPMVYLGAALARHRASLLGQDLGGRAPLFVLAAVAAFAGGWVARRRRKLLNESILMGVPELSRAGAGRLLTEGIYAHTRNPRYLEILLFLLAYTAFANYVGTWVLFLLMFPALHLVVLLEERELRDRFGAEYEDYCRHVPRYVPKWRPGA